MNEQGDITIADLAEDFNRYFASVFTIENMSSFAYSLYLQLIQLTMVLKRTSYGIYPLRKGL